MGSIWTSKNELVATSSELVGKKAGIALSRNEVAEFLPNNQKSWATGRQDEVIRIRAEEFKDAIAALLYSVGNIPDPNPVPPGAAMCRKYRNDAAGFDVMHRVYDVFFRHAEKFLTGHLPPASRKEDLELVWARRTLPDVLQALVTDTELAHDFLQVVEVECGPLGSQIAKELVALELEDQHRSPWTEFRRKEWKDQIELNDLFASEGLTCSEGKFIDQRFVDFLAANFDRVDHMNWRKFEGLVCEYFERKGYRVEIGKGRNDGGVDARVWRPDSAADSAPLILVQCKRQRQQVEQVVVKALWADVVAERAKSGLVVTTSRLEPGAKRVCVARGYPITGIERDSVRRWLDALRTPNTGVFLGW